MRGKVGLVVGLAAGYVLGTRAGRERYEQIKSGFLTVWNTDPVQKQVTKVTDFGKSVALAVPSTLWKGVVKITQAATSDARTPGERLDAVIDASKDAADDAVEAATTPAKTTAKTTPAKTTAKKPAAKKPAARTTAKKKSTES